ncbi:MAG TPA: type III pantothenate kinase [Exilispira sp.]|nr:type III pantothenate kinase [Exilispira sp.]
MIILLDIGNTRIKLGLTRLESDDFQQIKSFKNTNLFLKYIKTISTKYDIQHLVYSSVRGKETENIIQKLNQILNSKSFESNFIHKNNKKNSLKEILIHRINYDKKYGFDFYYEPIKSYGDDRLALLFYLSEKYPLDSIFAIDSGTALTIDTMYKKNYEGGAIFPGINLSIKSLFYKTKQLPLVNENDLNNPYNIDLINNQIFGYSTKECILSGIYNSYKGFIIYSYKKFIEKIEKKYQLKGLLPKILITGGDANLIFNLIKSIECQIGAKNNTVDNITDKIKDNTTNNIANNSKNNTINNPTNNTTNNTIPKIANKIASNITNNIADNLTNNKTNNSNYLNFNEIDSGNIENGKDKIEIIIEENAVLLGLKSYLKLILKNYFS